MKIRISLLVVFICISGNIKAQKSPDFLKCLPALNADTPAWAIEMYKSEPNVLLVDELYRKYFTSQVFEKTIHTQNYKHWRRAVEEYLQEDGSLQFPSIQEIYKKQQKIVEKRQTLNRSEGEWKAIGPMDTYSTGPDQQEVSWQANVYTIDQSVSDPNTVYAGTEAGGIFRSDDKGETWEMASASYPIRSVTSIKVDPSNSLVVYAGDGSQIIKTEDGGESWVQLMAAASLGVNDIAISKTNSSLVLLASASGLYRSTDAGQSWEKILEQRIVDIEFNAERDQEIYALVSNPSGLRAEFWKSTDAGVSFSIRENGWYNSDDPTRADRGGRMTITPADPDRIYTILIGQSKPGDHGFIGVYRSDDGGESWYNPNPPDGGPYDDEHPNLVTLNNTNTLQQGYYNLGIAASHEDPDQLLLGALNLWNSKDGGASFEAKGGYQGNVPWLHPDQQEIEINGTDMWVANDGGVNYSNDLFESHESRKKGLLASDFWGFSSGWNEDLIVGGRYHNGNTAYRPSFEDGRFLRLGGAEAATGYVSPGKEGITYFSDINAKNIPYSLDDAVMDAPNIGLFPSESFYASHYSELEFGADCYGHIWIGRENGIWKSEDGGNTFDLVQAFGNSDQTIQQFEISRVNPKIIYVYQRTSFYGASLWVSEDGGESFTEKEFPNISGSMRAGSLQIDSQNPEKLYVAFAHQNNDGEKIFLTEDYGDSWSNVTDVMLDGETIHCLFQHAGTDDLYVGTDYGVYLYDGSEWMSCSEGLPIRFNTNRMAPLYMKNKIRIASYGNGVWELDLRKNAAPMAQATVDRRVGNCSRDTFYFDDYSTLDQESNATWSWNFTPAPAYVSDYNARNPKVVFADAGTYRVELTVSNDHGSDTYANDAMIEILESECDPDIYPDQDVYCFGGGSDFIQTGDLNVVVAEFTMTAWIKSAAPQNDYVGIIFNDGDSFGLNFSIDNQLGFHHPSAGSEAWAWSSGLYIPNSEWVYVALVVQSDGAALYLNGERAFRPLTLNPVLLSSLKLGSYRGWESRNYTGQIDEVTIWDRALSAEEIRTHKHITKNEENAEGLIAYYQFNEAEGQVLNRVGLVHANLQGGAQRFNSMAPIGGGQAITLTDPSMTSFNSEELQIGAELNIDFGEAITFTKLDIAPSVPGPDPLLVNDSYWIINKYGDDLLGQLRFLNLDLNPALLENSGSVNLNIRSDNEDIREWEIFNASTSISASEIVFDSSPLENAQLLLSEKDVSSTEIAVDDEIQLFPNPASDYINLEVEGEWSFSLMDAKGNILIRDRKIKGHQLDIEEEIPNGNYFYLLTSDDKMKTGQIAIFR